MARAKLRAEFFVGPDAVVIRKAPPLKYRERKAIYERDQKRCQECDREVIFGGNVVSPFVDYTCSAIDHIFPRSRGGQNHPNNLQLLCISCNAAKGAY